MFNLSRRDGVKIGIDAVDFCSAAKQVNLSVAHVRTVDEIESAGSGFLERTQRPKILFEGHLFYSHLKKKGLHMDGIAIDPTIVYPVWTKVHYLGNEREYIRLAKAVEICKALGISDAFALWSASWGRYQILGSNFLACGYASVEDMVEAMFQDEDNHLEAFVNYILELNLDDLLRAGNWSRFALRYNGPGYKRNNYHIKLPNAFAKFSRQHIDCESLLHGQVIDVMPGERSDSEIVSGFDDTSFDDRHVPPLLRIGSTGIDVEILHERLAELGYPTGDLGDSFGQQTLTYVKQFQNDNGLTADGLVGENTRNKLFA